MSVMDELKNVVTTGRELLATVSGKMREIDNKVFEAARQFENFTTVDFPIRVQRAQSIDIYIDAENGDNSNIGTSASSPMRTIEGVKSLLSRFTYKEITVRFRGGQTHILNVSDAVSASEKITISPYSGSDGEAILKQGFEGSGAPVRNVFSAPYVKIDGFSSQKIWIHTAIFGANHKWQDWLERTDKYQAVRVYALIQSPRKIKTRYVELVIGDVPLYSIYAQNSGTDNASYEMIVTIGSKFTQASSGEKATDFIDYPFFGFVYGSSGISYDFLIISVSLEGFEDFSSLFHGLSTTNVRSNISF